MQELSEAQKRLEDQAQRLRDRQEQSAQLESSLKECKDKLLASEQRVEQLEGLSKVCIRNTIATIGGVRLKTNTLI